MSDDWLIIGLVIGFVIGAVVLFVLKPGQPAASYPYTVRPLPSRTYSNLEEWEIIKDEEGRVKGVKVHRTAKVV